ncbi:MAG: SDR family NAD(P)-dependent oxidoreductase [Pseudolabrys sp.]
MARKRKGDGQTALVTGASMGIGVELARCYAEAGYDLILTARSAEALDKIAAEFSAKHKVKAAPIACDLGVIGAGDKLAQQIAARGLAVDVLVNNAGYGVAGAYDGSDRTEEMGMIDLNVRALAELTHIYWPHMLANKRGGVLNVASTAAFQPGPLMAIYYASKAFVLSFSEALWKEAEGTGVHVSCLCPGPTESNFRARAGTGKTRLSRNMGTPMTSAAVAKQSYRGFASNRRVVVTGARNRFLASAAPFLPRKTLLGIVHNMQSPA